MRLHEEGEGGERIGVRRGRGGTEMSTHAEAFKLMKYRTEDGAEWEIIWNGRDGVTPFVIESRTGKEMTHVDWDQDVITPVGYKPNPGTRMFVDATKELLRTKCWKYVNKYWKGDGTMMNPGMQSTFQGKSRAAVVDYFLDQWTKPGSPCLVEILEDGTYEVEK